MMYSKINSTTAGLEKNYNLNLPFGQASLKFHLPGQDFMNCNFSLVHEQLVHILAHRASEWGKSLVRHKNLLVLDDWTGPFSSPTQESTAQYIVTPHMCHSIDKDVLI